MAAIAVPDEVCEEEDQMAPHFAVRSSAVRVTQPTSPASISAATEGDVCDGPGFPGRDSGRAFFPARLCRPSISAFPSLFPVHSDGRERAVGVRNQDTEPCLTMACARRDHEKGRPCKANGAPGNSPRAAVLTFMAKGACS
jgi:hypothetical protein